MSGAAVSSRRDAARPEDAAERVYYPALDGLRFVAFALVYLFHGGVPLPLLSPVIGRTAARALCRNGWVGVPLFFLLSGFLITTLLLREESRFGRIDLGSFWVRRALRIWPLYYLTVAVGFFLVPWASGHLGTPEYAALVSNHLPAFLTFLGNWSMALRGPVPYDAISILWSVCVEEQFYLFVPLLLAGVPRRGRWAPVLGLTGCAVALRAALARRGVNPLLIHYNSFAQSDAMLAGVLLALLRETSWWGAVARWSGWWQWPLYGAVAWTLARPDLGHGSPAKVACEPVAVWLCGAGFVVLAIARAGWLRTVMSAPAFVWLGQISYGLYMYHEVALGLKGAVRLRLPSFPGKPLLLALVAFAITVGLAAASYFGYERRFLVWKRSWTRVPSRPV
jgi:peptidoglycan/LPS O-acetylase OafA/YrhL